MNDYKIPNHVGIILDGNGRWAKEKGLKRSEGHRKGADNLIKLTKYAFRKGVNVLSVFAFSTENFKRSDEEVNYLMKLFTNEFRKYIDEFNENNIKVVFSGRKEPLKDSVYDSMQELANMTKDNTGKIFNICLNYGGRAEIVDTTKKLVNATLKGIINVEDITEELFKENLYNDLPDIDFLIRTSGEVRVSNFMLYQLAYAEMYFPKVYFPDFNESEFDKSLDVYNKRDRRFGGISENE